MEEFVVSGYDLVKHTDEISEIENHRLVYRVLVKF